MKRLKEKAAYQWQVLGWRGAITELFLFVGIVVGFLDLIIVVSLSDEIYAESSGIFVAVLYFGFMAMIAILIWAARFVWNEFERNPYKRAESGGENDYE